MKKIQMHQATESRRPFRSTQTLGAKRELFDKVSAASMRTCEVTICIIPEGLLNRLQQ